MHKHAVVFFQVYRNGVKIQAATVSRNSAAIQFFKIEEFKGLLSIRVLSSSGLCVVLIFLFKVNGAGKRFLKFVQ